MQALTLADRSKLRVLLASLLSVIFAGCRGGAQREVYDAQMAHEIRVLEDQLYEADYQNRILVDQIESLKLKSAAPFHQRLDQNSDEAPRNRPSIPTPVRPEFQQSPNSNYLPAPSNDPLLDKLNDLDAIIDDGKQEPLMPAPPSIENLELPSPTASPPSENGLPSQPTPLPSGGSTPQVPEIQGTDDRLGYLPPSSTVSNPLSPVENSSPSRRVLRFEGRASAQEPLLAAPGGPEPPGRNSLIAPPVIHGEMLPPPSKNPEPLQPPGQIILPDSPEAPTPEQLKLHSSLSGGRELNGEIEQMMLVVNVLDKNGRPLELANYDVNADLSVVLFDGEMEQTEANRLGRWDFKPHEVVALVKDEPVSGFHIPIHLNEMQPQHKVVLAHVRLRSEEDEMRCNGTVRVTRENAAALWAPRADSTYTSR